MSKKRLLDTKFWSDGFIKEKLNPLDRYLFLYFLTNEKTNIAGIYELPLSTIASETGIATDMLKKMIVRLKPKIFYLDGWVWVRNFQKHQSTSSEKIKRGIEIETTKIPNKILDRMAEINKKLQETDRVSIGYGNPIIYSNSNLNSNSNNTADKSAPSLKEKINPNIPMTCAEFVEICRKSPHKHIQVIGEWAEAENPTHTTYGEWQSFIKRNLRVAKSLSAYEVSKIEKAYNLMLKDVAREERGRKVGFITKYTLETVGKYIDKV